MGPLRLPLPVATRAQVLAALEDAESAWGDGDVDRARSLAARCVRRALKSGCSDLAAEALVVEVTCLLELERFSEAVRRAEQAIGLDPASAPAWKGVAEAAYRSADFGHTLAAIQRCLDIDPDDADAHGLAARALVWVGDEQQAEVHFARAAALDPSQHVVPFRLSEAEFDDAAAAVWQTIPPQFRARMENIIVAVEPLPDVEDVEDGQDPDLLGLYEGGTVMDEDGPPQRVLLFQRNHENVCKDGDGLREEIRRTILHEVGHHFGMDHDQLPF